MYGASRHVSIAFTIQYSFVLADLSRADLGYFISVRGPYMESGRGMQSESTRNIEREMGMQIGKKRNCSVCGFRLSRRYCHT